MPCSSALAACCSNGLGCAACEGCLNVLPVAGAYQGRPPAVGQVQRVRAGAWQRSARSSSWRRRSHSTGVWHVAPRLKILSDQPGSGTSRGPTARQAAAGLPITAAAATIRTVPFGAARAEWFSTTHRCCHLTVRWSSSMPWALTLHAPCACMAECSARQRSAWVHAPNAHALCNTSQ